MKRKSQKVEKIVFFKERKKSFYFHFISHRELTSKNVCKDIKDALKEGQEKHFEILYYKKNGK